MNRNAVVAGGGRGIGRAVAIELATRGARVGVLARTVAELDETVATIERRRGSAIALCADMSDENQVRGAFEHIASCVGPVDVLVNSAARCWPIGPFAEGSMSEWWQTLVVNLRGPVLASRAVLPSMIARRSGRIINIASSTRPYAYLSSYVVSKTALARFSQTLANEVRREGIFVFAVGPGTVRTAMAENSLAVPEGQKWIPWFARIFEEGLDVPMERPVQLICDLACGKADVLTGRFITVFDNLEGLRDLVNLEKIGASGTDRHTGRERDEILGSD